MGLRRARVKRPQPLDHPTRLLFLNVAADLLKENGPAGFHIDDVLERTDLTRGALYHHFDNVDDLVDSALLQTYAEGVGDNIVFVQKVLLSATTFTEFRTGILEANIRYVRNEKLRQVRRLRAHAMSTNSATERMASLLAAEQQRLTDEYIAAITAAQTKGWVRPEIDPHALAVFVQAYSFGVIVDDVAANHVDSEAWTGLIESFYENCVFVSGTE